MGEKLLDAYGIEVQLTREQNACITYTGEKTLIIKGLAGTGKSLLLAAIAIKKYRESTTIKQNKIAIFTYQTSLISTMQEILLKNDIPQNSIYVGTIQSYANKLYEGMEERGIVSKNEYIEQNSYNLKIKRNFVKKALIIFQQEYGYHHYTKIDTDIWIEEFNWMKDMNIWTDNKQYFLDLVDENTRIEEHMTQHEKELIYYIYCLYCDLLAETNQAEYIDQILTMNRKAEDVQESDKFDYVLVDEGQEYSNAQIQFIHHIAKETVYIAMDINQKLYEKSWRIQQIGIESVTRKLSQTMRMTTAIDELAESLRTQNDKYLNVDDRILNFASKKEGQMPQIIQFEDSIEEKEYMQKTVKKCLADDDTNTIGIIASTKLSLETYMGWLTEVRIPFEVITPDTPYTYNTTGVKIVTVYGAKGLEFDYVIIPQFVEGVFPFTFKHTVEEEEKFYYKMRNLVYLAMTRAKKNLVLTMGGKNRSRFIEELIPTGYEWFGADKPEPKTMYSDTSRVKPKQSSESEDKMNLTGSSNVGIMEYLKNQGVEFIDKRVIDRES